MPNGDNTRITANGQIPLQEEKSLAIYALKVLQEAMQGEAERAGIASPEDVVNIVRKLRSRPQA